MLYLILKHVNTSYLVADELPEYLAQQASIYGWRIVEVPENGEPAELIPTIDGQTKREPAQDLNAQPEHHGPATWANAATALKASLGPDSWDEYPTHTTPDGEHKVNY